MHAEQLVAHRGWQQQYPENTLLGIQAALELGARHIEIDVQLNAEHIPLLCHDQLLQRLCNSSLNIHHCSMQQLATLSVYEPDRLGNKFLGTPLSTLSDCVELIRGYPEVILYVEIKNQSLQEFGGDSVCKALLPLLQAIASQCVIISFDIHILQQLKQLGWQKVAPVLTNWQQAFSDEILQLAPALLFCNAKFLNEGDNRTPSQLPFDTAFYEIADPQQAQKLLDQGAALIETFDIKTLLLTDTNNEYYAK